jgi:hypothetical protein
LLGGARRRSQVSTSYFKKFSEPKLGAIGRPVHATVAMGHLPPIFGHRPSQEENESPRMPSARLNDSAFDAQLEGVYFGM